VNFDRVQPRHLVEAPSLHEAVEALERTNWTSVVTQIEDPANRNYAIGFAFVCGLALCLFGYRCLRICK